MKQWSEIFEQKLEGWWLSFIRILPNILLALLIFIAAIYIARFVKKSLFSLSIKISGKSSFSNFFATTIQIVIMFVGLFIALDILQLNRALSSLLAGAGIVGIILGFAFQDITSNFISGIYIAFKKPFEVGHTVKTNDYIGHIEEIQLRSTTIRTFSGLHLMIPNKEIIQKPMINYSLTRERRIELEFYIDHNSELELAHRVCMEAIAKIEYLFPGKAIEIYFNDFSYTAIKVSVWFWINNHEPPGYMVARHDAIFNLTQALKEQDISLVQPFALDQLQTAKK